MDRARDRGRTAALALALAIVPAAGACNPFASRYARNGQVEMHGDGATMAAQWNGALVASADPGAASSITGAVAATPGLDGASTYVHVSVASAPPGAAYAWRLREGPCGGGGRVVGAANAYGPLAANEQGRAAGTATLPLRLTPGARYHVHVGAAAGEPDRAVACGDLTPPTR